MIEIKRANLRDASYVTAHLNEHDHREVFCQLPDDVDNGTLARWLLINGDAWIAYRNERPVMVFGTTPMTVCVLSAWAMGTVESWRVIPAVSRHFVNVQLPARIEQGFTSMEARALTARHGDVLSSGCFWDEPTRRVLSWFDSFGGVPVVADLEAYGKGGEDFALYRWTVAGYRSICEGRWSENHVLQHTKSNVIADCGTGHSRAAAE